MKHCPITTNRPSTDRLSQGALDHGWVMNWAVKRAARGHTAIWTERHYSIAGRFAKAKGKCAFTNYMWKSIREITKVFHTSPQTSLS